MNGLFIFDELLIHNIDKNEESLFKIWQDYYASKFQSIKSLCEGDYLSSGYDLEWMAKTHVFNHTKRNLQKMKQANDQLETVIIDVLTKIPTVFGMDLDVLSIVYHGLGNGAGWVTQLDGEFVVLFGVEKMAELDILSYEAIEGLVAHELCHVIHFKMRNEEIDESGIMQLYAEGFAQYYQTKLSSRDFRGESWYANCLDNEQKLKQIFLEKLTTSTQDFFGDWHNVLGISDTGYFLGARFIEQLAVNNDAYRIATLSRSEIEVQVLAFLKS